MAEKIEGRKRAERKKHKLNILIFNDNVIILKFVKLHILNKTDIDIFNKTCILIQCNLGLQKIYIRFFIKWQQYFNNVTITDYKISYIIIEIPETGDIQASENYY